MSIKKKSIGIFLISTLLFFSAINCQFPIKDKKASFEEKKDIVVGANQTEKYIDLLKDRKIALVANHTSVIFKNDKTNSDYQHLVDSLLSLKINIIRVFAPEHGFRGNADAGEQISDINDPKTGLPIISLYGKNKKPTPAQLYNYKKPTPAQLNNVDVLVFDIQDVGVRFYTYISTLFNVMEACAENGIPVIVL